jgi:hypothetical protein
VPGGDIFHHVVEVRDATSAPVATLVPTRGGRLELRETGGPVLAFTWREEIELATCWDDKWGLAVFEERSQLDRRALVALPLVCRLMAHNGHPLKTMQKRHPGMYGAGADLVPKLTIRWH